MRVVATADLHGAFPEIPECDLLLIAGDVCPVDESHTVPHQRAWLRETFSPWLQAQPAEEIVWIGGNHDFACEAPGFKRSADELPGHYLMDDSIELFGMKIYGSPWVPNLMNWAFYGRDEAFEQIAERIPEDTDILVLHGVPGGVGLGDPAYPSWDSPQIASRLQTVLPKLCVFGHVHQGYGTKKIGEVEFANVAHMDVNYRPVNPPMVFEILPH